MCVYVYVYVYVYVNMCLCVYACVYMCVFETGNGWRLNDPAIQSLFDISFISLWGFHVYFLLSSSLAEIPVWRIPSYCPNDQYGSKSLFKITCIRACICIYIYKYLYRYKYKCILDVKYQRIHIYIYIFVFCPNCDGLRLKLQVWETCSRVIAQKLFNSNGNFRNGFLPSPAPF